MKGVTRGGGDRDLRQLDIYEPRLGFAVLKRRVVQLVQTCAHVVARLELDEGAAAALGRVVGLVEASHRERVEG